MSKKAERSVFLFYIIAFLLIAATIALYQPLEDTPPAYGNPPDEHARFLVPWYICENGTLPTGFEEEVRIPGYGFSYALYTAFPYIVQGYVMRFVHIFTDSKLILLYAGRFVNVLLGTCMAYVVYLLSKKLFKDARFRWLFCFAVMFLPQSLFVHTYINTDSMCLLATSMMVYALVGAYQEGFTRKNNLWLSAGIILCALSYYNAYGFILSSILLFLAYFLQKKEGKWRYDWKEMLKKGIFISVIVLLGIGWWFIRSYILFDGDILGLATKDKMAAQYAVDKVNPLTMSTYQNMGYTISQMMKENHFWKGVSTSFVASYGSMSIWGHIWMYRFYLIIFLVGMTACAVLGWRRKKNNGPLTLDASVEPEGWGLNTENAAEKWKRAFFHINMIFCILMPLFMLIFFAYTMDYQNQGRYLLPAIIPLMYYLARGLQKLAGLKWVPRWLQNTGVCLAVILFVGSTLYIVYGKAMPVYLQTPVLR